MGPLLALFLRAVTADPVEEPAAARLAVSAARVLVQVFEAQRRAIPEEGVSELERMAAFLNQVGEELFPEDYQPVPLPDGGEGAGS